MTDENEDNGFFSRWSRRKRHQTTGEDSALASQMEARGERPSSPSAETAPDIDAADLPDIESLTRDSDFSPFLQDGVPEVLKRRALRKLWGLDPVFANLDGLNDYDLDYTDAATVVENLRSAYQAGRGYFQDDEASQASEVKTPTDETEAPISEAPASSEDRDVSGDVSDRDAQMSESPPAASRDADVVEGNGQDVGSVDEPVSRPVGTARQRRWGDG